MLHVKKKKYRICCLYIYPQTFDIVFFLPDHQSMIVGNPVTLGCSVQANPMHTTVVWRDMMNGVATDLPASSRYSGSTVSNPSPSITNAHSSDLGIYV